MRISNYVVRPDHVGWIVATVKTKGSKSKHTGEQHETDRAYYGRFDQALRSLLDRMVRDEIEPSASLSEAVATVAHLYATIGDAKP